MLKKLSTLLTGGKLGDRGPDPPAARGLRDVCVCVCVYGTWCGRCAPPTSSNGHLLSCSVPLRAPHWSRSSSLKRRSRGSSSSRERGAAEPIEATELLPCAIVSKQGIE